MTARIGRPFLSRDRALAYHSLSMVALKPVHLPDSSSRLGFRGLCRELCVVFPNHLAAYAVVHRDLLGTSRSSHARRREGAHNGQADPTRPASIVLAPQPVVVDTPRPLASCSAGLCNPARSCPSVSSVRSILCV